MNSEEKYVTDFHVFCVFFYAKEMNHRFYSYRMKQQGRSWSSEEMEYMVWVLTARKNKTLTQALLYHANGKSYKKMDRAMHKAVVQAECRMRNLGQDAWKGV